MPEQTVTSAPPSDSSPWTPSARLTTWVVAALATLALAVRLTYVQRAFGTDEAGFLEIAQQWHGPGTSLYTDQWVDRPPLLLVMFQLGDLMGGLTGVRILGAILAAVIITGTAVAAHQLAGRRSAVVAAVAMTAWSITPAFASITVNGEYLAAPFIVWSIVATLAALRAVERRRALLLGVVAGALAFAAVLVKQNHADGLLFGLLACVFAPALLGTDRVRSLQVFLAAAVGALATTGATALLCVARGTSIAGVYEAMYPFRFEADGVKRTAGVPPFVDRFASFGHVWLVSGVLIVTVVAALVGLLDRRHRTLVLILGAMLVFVHVSVAAGLDFYPHYMVQLLVPVALLAGVASARSRWLVPAAVALAVAAAAFVTPASMFAHAPSTISRAGGALEAVGEPGDSIMVLYGRPGIVFASGMDPAYEYLFSLPLRVRDPKLTGLTRVVAGDDPPTWLVTWGAIDTYDFDTDALRQSLEDRYTVVADVCGHPVWLLDGVDRQAPEDACATG